MITNEFEIIAQQVEKVLKRYREVRKVCGIADDAWHSRSIERIAKPFIKGYFTLAIVGKVSSGKSTFINALLGCKDLLPTGHDQTTCGITCVEYGDAPEITITFADGHKSIIKDDIRGKVKPYVAIPEKYHHLPVNKIDEMIIGGFDFDKIWEVREQIEKETQCSKIDKTLLKEYVKNRKKKDIAVEVRMKYPFNDELKGWRVIDTPGIGAIGGIEERTKQLLAEQKEDGSREVDAIIFLQDGSQTLDQTDTRKFVNEQLDNLTESDKCRLFFVLTRSSSSEFLNHKDSKLDFINQNYGDKIKCLTYADSLLYTFLNHLAGSEVDLKAYDDFKKPDDWAEDEWDAIMGILDHAKRHLRNTGDAFNNDTMLRTIRAWAAFDSLKSEINQFAKNEKQKFLRKLLKLIASDYLGFIRELSSKKKLLDKGLAAINKEREGVENIRLEYNTLFQKADKKISLNEIKSKFQFVDNELENFMNLESVDSVRAEITNLFDHVQKVEKEFFEEIAKEYSDFFKGNDLNDIVLESLDFDAILQEATSQSEEEYEVAPERVIHNWTKPNERIPAQYEKRINEDEKLRLFKAQSIKKARMKRDKFLPQMTQKVYDLRDCILKELHKKINNKEVELEKLKGDLARKEESMSEYDKNIAASYAASNDLIKLAETYGIEIKYKK